MDHYGIGAAMQAMMRVYLNSARRTGRTMSLVESVKDGDRIIFADQQECNRVEHICLERGVKVKCIVINPDAPRKLLEYRTSEGRTIFDHSWVEDYYLKAIEYAAENIDRLERQTSGYGVAHRETRRRAEEITRWRL